MQRPEFDDKQIQKLLDERSERLKELACINQTSVIIKQERPINETLNQIVHLLPRAWQYPDYTIARITFEGKEYKTPHFKPTPWSQVQVFRTIDGRSGTIEVFYVARFPEIDEGPFLKEERDLIDNLAALIAGYINSLIAKEKLARREAVLSSASEHQKELKYLSLATKILQRGDTIDNSLQKIVSLLPKAWRYPEFTVARIIFDGKEYYSAKFMPSQWVQRHDFETESGKEGTIEIYYTKSFPLSDEGPFGDEERHLLESIASLITVFINNYEIIHSSSEIRHQTEKLMAENTERLKELACINETTAILKMGQPIEKTLQQISYILPKAWQYPDFTVARIRFEGKKFESYYFKQTKWMLRQPFETIDKRKGAIEVFYLKEFPKADEGPFLQEERALINNLASLIVGYLNSIQGKEALNKYRQLAPPSEKMPLINSRQLLQNFMNRNNSSRDLYHDLMKFKVKEILLVANLYDAYSIEREGRFSEHILGHYHQLNLPSLPRITGASTYEEAVAQLHSTKFDLIIMMMGVDKKTPIMISERIKEEFPEMPIFLLLNNNKDIALFGNRITRLPTIDKIFVWNGDSRIFFAMVKYLEDQKNVENDTKVGLVRVMLLVEDSAKYYSRYLPALYSSIMDQTKLIINDVSTDELYRILRLRVRPKILLASTYEEAIDLYNKYGKYLLCMITDVKFKKDNQHVNAGFTLVKHIRNHIKDLPTIIQSSDLDNKTKAKELKCRFIHKNSESLTQDIKDFISVNLGFGNFVFRSKDEEYIAEAHTLREFKDLIKTIPAESLLYHSQHNHFSMWLRARGEYQIAEILSPLNVSDFTGPNAIRSHLLATIQENQNEKNRGRVVEFNDKTVLDPHNIVSLANGGFGGKGRGLAFINTLLYSFDFQKYLPHINIRTPQTAIIGTNEFELFLKNNDLYDTLHKEKNYETIKRKFIEGELSEEVSYRLHRIVEVSDKPLAVRSSGLFEDSLMQPFAGIFATYILPNSHNDIEVRQQHLEEAVKLVYASVYSKLSRGYIEAINYKLEEEKMAVVIQEVVGNEYKGMYYPHISGVAQSYNFYPFGHMEPDDGFSVIAIGLGTYVVEGEKAYRFSPKYPTTVNASPKDQFANSQVEFFAVNRKKKEINLLEGENAGLARLDLDDAEMHGTLTHCASVYNPDNNTIAPGLDKPGPRIVNFADVLKYNYIPLSETLEIVLDVVKEALGSPVEIEFAVDLNKDKDYRATFYLLQIKPLTGSAQDYTIDTEKLDHSKLIFYTEKGMGNGHLDDIRDVIFVDKNNFEKSKTVEIAAQIENFNNEMKKQKKNYVLIGPGRWGTRDRWIGIPVNWPQISNAKVIIETSLEGYPLDSSSGSHFFHNVTSMNVGYFSIEQQSDKNYLKWDELYKQKVVNETQYIKHVRFDEPLNIKMDGRKRIAMISEDKNM